MQCRGQCPRPRGVGPASLYSQCSSALNTTLLLLLLLLHWTTSLHCTNNCTEHYSTASLQCKNNCTERHCTIMHFIALHFTSLLHSPVQWTALQCNALHCMTILYSTAQLQFTALQCTVLHCTALQYNALHCMTVLYSTAQLHCTILYCTALSEKLCVEVHKTDRCYNCLIYSRVVSSTVLYSLQSTVYSPLQSCSFLYSQCRLSSACAWRLFSQNKCFTFLGNINQAAGRVLLLNRLLKLTFTKSLHWPLTVWRYMVEYLQTYEFFLYILCIKESIAL